MEEAVFGEEQVLGVVMRYACPKCSTVIDLEEDEPASPGVCETCGTSLHAPSSLFSEGAVIGDFILQRKLGSGAMGTVYLSHQISLERPVALKILHRHLAEDRRYVERIMKEARTAASFNHPNLIQAYAVGEENGICFLAMEYVEGRSLEDLLAEVTRLSADHAADIICQVAAGLHAAWTRARIVHGDIKPENLMVSQDDVVKIADMGLATPGIQDLENFEYSTEVTGSPCYMSPEMILGQPVDNRSDLYSLGITFFQAVTGVLPFEGRDALDVASKHICAEIPPPLEIVPELPERIAEIICKLMAKDPRDRYQSSEDLIAALKVGEMATVALGAPIAEALLEPGECWECPSCEHRNPMTGKYCRECGAYGFEPCPNCSREVTVDARFCPECGADLRREKEVIQQTWDALLGQFRTAHDGGDLERASDTAARMLTADATHLPDASVQAFTEALKAFREDLEAMVEAARKGYRLDALQLGLKCLNKVFGEEGYEWLNTELKATESKLANVLYEANAAFKTNCFSKCREIIQEIPPWQGGNLADRRGELAAEAEVEEVTRADLLAQATRVLEKGGDHADAVRYVHELSQYRLSDKVLVVEPADRDREANERIRELSEKLNSRSIDGLTQWIAEERWSAVQDLMRAVKKCDSRYMASHEKALWQVINEEIRRRYELARNWERRKAVAKARQAWDDVLEIPGELLPGKVRKEARGFTDRRRNVYLASRRPSLSFQLSILFFFWCFSVCFEAVELARLWMDGGFPLSALRGAAVPLGLQILILAVFYRILRSRRVMVSADLITGVHPSWYAMLTCLLWILSPASGVLYRCYLLTTGRFMAGTVWSELWPAAAVVALFWLLGDLLRFRHWRGFPNILAFTLSWIGAATIAQVLWRNAAWTPLRHLACGALQAGLFVVLEAISYLVNRKRAATG